MSVLYIRIRHDAEFHRISEDVIRRFSGLILCLFEFKLKLITLHMAVGIYFLYEPFISIEIISHHICGRVVIGARLIAAGCDGLPGFGQNDRRIDLLPVFGVRLGAGPVPCQANLNGLLAAVRFDLHYIVIVAVSVGRSGIQQDIVLAAFDRTLIFGGSELQCNVLLPCISFNKSDFTGTGICRDSGIVLRGHFVAVRIGVPQFVQSVFRHILQTAERIRSAALMNDTNAEIFLLFGRQVGIIDILGGVP